MRLEHPTHTRRTRVVLRKNGPSAVQATRPHPRFDRNRFGRSLVGVVRNQDEIVHAVEKESLGHLAGDMRCAVLCGPVIPLHDV